LRDWSWDREAGEGDRERERRRGEMGEGGMDRRIDRGRNN
jgi:hypothetical protein